MPRTSYLQQVARQGIGDRSDLHPPHPLLRRWQTLQDMPGAGGPTAAPVADLPASALSNASSGRDSVHLPPEMSAFLPRLSQQDDTVPLVERTPQPGAMLRAG